MDEHAAPAQTKNRENNPMHSSRQVPATGRGDAGQPSDMSGEPAATAQRRGGQADYGRITVNLNGPPLAAA
jgi:hypothetical protein